MPLTDTRQAQPQAVFDGLEQETRDFYLQAMQILDSAAVPYVVGGAYALASYTGIVRHTKDFDTFLRQRDLERALDAFEKAGFRTEMTHPHWVAKAFNDRSDDPDFVDFIYGSGNGICLVDDVWLERARDGQVLGRSARLCPPEEMIWSKSFVMERDRYDGADVAHLLYGLGSKLDWAHLIDRFGENRALLLSYLILFGFIYPSEKSRIPREVIDQLTQSVRDEPESTRRICRGTLMSWSQYLPDVNERGFIDARLRPDGNMTDEQVERWTDAEK